MTNAEDIRWLAERISPDIWCWDGWPKMPAALDQPEYTLRLRHWASRRPWWGRDVQTFCILEAERIMDPELCAAEVFRCVLTAEREWAKKEGTNDLAHD